MDGLPEHIRLSSVLTGNDLARLDYIPALPAVDPAFLQFEDAMMADSLEIELAMFRPKNALYAWLQTGNRSNVTELHRIAQVFIAQGKVEEAWQTLLMQNSEQ
jgi:hypothetical protein